MGVNLYVYFFFAAIYSESKVQLSINLMAKLKMKQLWSSFIAKHNIISDGVPLFATAGLCVRTKQVGKTYIRNVLERSTVMEALVETECDKLIADWHTGKRSYDGLIYLMYKLSSYRKVVPLYIGKTETSGKKANLSINIKRLKTDKSKFARWGDGHQYHIGDLSAATLPNYPESKIQPKYVKWAQELFTETPSCNPILKTPVYFWAKAWSPNDVSIWSEFSPTRLTFLEYQLIGVASTLFPNDLLNEEGQNRA